MIKYILILIFIFSLKCRLFAEDFWIYQVTGTNKDIVKIICPDSDKYKSRIFVITTDEGYLLSFDNGNSFLRISIDFKINDIYVTNDTIYLATTDNGVIHHISYSENIILGLEGFNNKVIFVDNKGYIYVGVEGEIENKGGIYRTTDYGENWDKLIDGIEYDHTNGNIDPYNITSINDTLYFMSSNGFYYSADDGVSWNMILSDQIDFKNKSPKKILADQSGDIFLLIDQIYIKQQGEDYNSITRTFILEDSIKYRDMVLYQTYSIAIPVSEDYGVCYSQDKGKTLIFPDNTVLGKYFYCLSVSESGYLYAGGINGRVARSKFFVSNVEDQTALSLNTSPNPFSEKTKIQFNLDHPAQTKLTIYNLLGYEIEVLVDEYLPNGNHEAIFDGAAFPAGAYFFVLRAGGRIETGRMIRIGE